MSAKRSVAYVHSSASDTTDRFFVWMCSLSSTYGAGSGSSLVVSVPGAGNSATSPQDYALLPVSLTKPQTLKALSNLAAAPPGHTAKRLAQVQHQLHQNDPLNSAQPASRRTQSSSSVMRPSTSGGSGSGGSGSTITSCLVELSVSCRGLPEAQLIHGSHCAVALHVLDQQSYVTNFEFKGQTELQKCRTSTPLEER
jgi:hypothetical protein